MSQQLEEFKTVLKRRQIFSICGVLVTFFCIFAVNGLLTAKNIGHIPDFIRGFQSGLFCGLELVMVCYIFKIRVALKQEDALKKMYIAEHDERAASIRLHTFATSGVVSLGLLALAAIIAGFFDEKICLTLVIVLLALIFLKLLFKLYYLKKF